METLVRLIDIDVGTKRGAASGYTRAMSYHKRDGTTLNLSHWRIKREDVIHNQFNV